MPPQGDDRPGSVDDALPRPAAGTDAPPPAFASTILDVDLGAIVANWRHLCRRHRDGRVAGVVKADAYGLGARAVATALHAVGCRDFFVALPQEALEIRPLLPGAMVAVLNGLPPGSARLFAEAGIVPVLGALSDIAAWSSHAQAVGRRLPAIIQIDTGMNRLGLTQAAFMTLQHEPRRLDGLDVLYVLTHLIASEEPDSALNPAQRDRLSRAIGTAPAAPISFANSSGIFLGDAFASDLARPGAALYGVNPTPGRANPMRQAATLRARILAVRQIETGESIGYNATWRATRPTRVAVVGIGYADGISRALSNRGRVFFGGQALPLVGRVSMDLTTVDITDAPDAERGGWLEFLGPHNTADDVAAVIGTNGYEVLTSLGRRVYRRYIQP